jgi:hypothetical protein
MRECFVCGSDKAVHDYFSHAPPVCREHELEFGGFFVIDEAKIDEIVAEATKRGVEPKPAAIAFAKELLPMLDWVHPSEAKISGAGGIVFCWREPRKLDLEVESFDRGFFLRPKGDCTQLLLSAARAADRVKKIVVRTGDRGIP